MSLVGLGNSILGFLVVSIPFSIQFSASIDSINMSTLPSINNFTTGSSRINSLEGPIASLIFDTVPLISTKNQSFIISGQSNSTASIETDTSKLPVEAPYILDGYWRLLVYEDSVINFRANFTMVRSDGLDRHDHAILNFRTNRTDHIITNQSGITILGGISDIKTNGVDTWKDVPTFILINKYKTIEIGIDSKTSNNHFMGQPIQGVIKLNHLWTKNRN